MRRIFWMSALVFGLTSVTAAYGLGGEAEAEGPQPMDCEHPPADAVREVPEALSDWIALDCAYEGARLVEATGWQWRYPGSFFDHPLVTAGLGEATERTHDGPWYFKRVEKIKLSEAEREARHQQLAKEVPAYGEYIYKLHALVLVNAVNNYDETITLNLAFDSSGHVMGVPCSSSCRPEHAFYMERRK